MRLRSIGKPGAGDRAGAERIVVRGFVGGSQADGVALELLDHRQQVMRDGRRLRRLRVGVRAVNGIPCAARQARERVAQVERARRQGRNELPLPHPVHRHRHVVAAARGVQAAGDVLAAGLLDQALDVEEQVLVGAVVENFADAVERDAVERRPQGPRVVARK